jgi:hypothetical protein
MNEQKEFQEWAVVELFGHQRLAGRVSNQMIGTSNFVRIDVPATKHGPAFTKLYGEKAIYCISPVTEEIARSVAENIRHVPISIYDLQNLPKALPAADSAEQEYMGSDSDQEDLFFQEEEVING